MESVSQTLPLLRELAQGIAAQFGERCEVVVHDWSQPYESTIVHIEHGHVTGRKVGDPGTNLGLEVMRGTSEGGHRQNYVTRTKDGRLLRSTSIYLKNDAGTAIGALCINFDISELLAAEKALQGLVGMQELPPVQESFVSNVSDLLDSLIQEAEDAVGRPPALMSREERIRFIALLDRKGAFLVKKAGEKVCAYLGISKYTLYSDLEEAKAADAEGEQS
ncbi:MULTISPECIES: helix-turn-helix transcriptional regulator [unclassified Paenibacillus]|uniref:helix-turn-helix transcriptional regulator n=1 Tax=unclassified Paenibacillus TaxID=185978 RepID=UPI000955C396|nr:MULTISPECIES: helix-turn-helix transcriptional regulator [unclassified Paenibacillus]ASS67964.1 transcriptional regulator [Paenibacillus sp. RUD330]SIR42695.1 Predicted transcriptional regulator YheO, contains PAS and DNA-binding HTH domains [Paenibacillus sp. RU4X]SIR52790.1 Predicted transcriptional regulator YheO, contains PAS and DNA-binding HTH domains [Paenibacillus sp. RU4T]